VFESTPFRAERCPADLPGDQVLPTWTRRATTALSFTFAITLGLATTATLTAVNAPEAEASDYISGIDIASWQHPSGKAINWSSVAASGQRYAIIKATEDTNYRNPYYSGDVAGARAAGLIVGAYHFARPKKPLVATATAQADYFIATTGTLQSPKTLPPVLDFESNSAGLSKKQLTTWATTFLERVRTTTGRTPMIYSYDSFLRNTMGNTTAFNAYPLWYANYTKNVPAVMPGGWDRWTIWQYTSTGKVPGISGNVDINWFNGTEADLLALANGPQGPTCYGLPATIIGTGGNDNLTGTAGDDVIVGLGGNDTIDGGGGNDTICGGAGEDVLRGGSGDDRLDGGSGADRLYGGSGADRLDGGSGADRLVGGPGADLLYGGAGSDTMFGGTGKDRLFGGSGDDRMFGGSGADSMTGQTGSDRVNGGPGKDRLYGGPGTDVVLGGRGGDTIYGGPGDDRLIGGPGRDRIFGGSGSDRCTSPARGPLTRSC
jgi:GH25 family lysozyme M1 (1,4-beta-N-acetylmuramidase)